MKGHLRQGIRILFALLVTLTLLFTSAGGLSSAQAAGSSDINPPPDKDTPDHSPENDEPIIPSTTKVVDSAAAAGLWSVSPEGRLSFSRQSSFAKDLSPGDIIVSPPVNGAPYGLLLKVTKVTNKEKQIKVKTQPASLEEAIQQGTIDVQSSLSEADLVSTKPMPGVGMLYGSAAESTDGLQIILDDVVLADLDGDPLTVNDQIMANGSLLLDPQFEFHATIKHFELQSLSFINTTEERVDLEIFTQIDLVDFHRNLEIARFTFAPITIWVGSVPVVFVPILTVNVGVDGTVTVGMTSGVTQETTLVSGLVYENEQWTPIQENLTTFTYTPPTVYATSRLAAHTGPRMDLLLYGVAGPYAEVEGYLELLANLLNDPWWELYAGVRAGLGVKIEVLSHVIVSYEQTIFDQRWLLAQAMVPPPGHDIDHDPPPKLTQPVFAWQ